MAAWLASLVALLQLLAAVFAPLGNPPSAPSPAGHDVRASAHAAGIRVDAKRTGADVDVTVKGGELARVWRVTIAGTGGLATRRIVVTVETSDVAYAGGVEAWVGGKRVANEALDASFEYCDKELAMCVGSKGLSLPAGNSTLAVHATTSRYVAYRVTGAVREAHDAAFVFGPWISAKPLAI